MLYPSILISTKLSVKENQLLARIRIIDLSPKRLTVCCLGYNWKSRENKNINVS